MYGTAIVGVDGLQGGADAAALAATLTAPHARIALVYVSTVPFASHASTRQLDLADDSSLPALLTAERDLCSGEPAVLRVSAPTIGAGLEQAAERQEAELIVVGASRRHGVTRLLGDDARSVLRRTPCAVALAPSRYAQHPRSLMRVGAACDASPESEVAVAHAGLIAADCGSQLRALHVVAARHHVPGRGAAPHPGTDTDEAARRLPRVAGVDVEHVRGSIEDKLLEFSHDLDLLVCGSRHQRPLRRLAEGSTGEHLARRVTIPLLVTPPSDFCALHRWRAIHQPATA
jgi:nucleotide-binding universal stress UspA family protein